MAYLAKSHKRETPEDPTSTNSSEEFKHSTVNKPVFFTAAGLIIAFVLWAWVAPGQAETVIFGSMDWIAENLGWYYILTAGIIVLFVVIVALSRVGNTRLGPDHSRPKYRMFTWASMLFAAGIGVDLMFFSIAGPATNYLTPPEAEPLSDEAARMAAIWTMFHYGIPGWAMYALMGVALGLFAYRYHLPLSIRSAIAPIFGKRIHGATGNAVDVTATLGTIFGIATSLGIGVVFLNYGLSELFGLPTNSAVQVALIALAVLITVLSTVSGVDKGIRRLSELNVLLAVGLLLWILITGKTAELLGQLLVTFSAASLACCLTTSLTPKARLLTQLSNGWATGLCSSGHGGWPGRHSSVCSSHVSHADVRFESSSSVCSSFRSDSSCCLFPSLATQHCLPSATVMTHSSKRRLSFPNQVSSTCYRSSPAVHSSSLSRCSSACSSTSPQPIPGHSSWPT